VDWSLPGAIEFRHVSGLKVFLHEPHPQNTLLVYALERLSEGLRSTGEIE